MLWPGVATRWRRALGRLGWRVRRSLGWRAEGTTLVETLGPLRLVILPSVFNGVRLRTGAFLADAFDAGSSLEQARVLDLGTGSGIGAVVAARAGARVTATDINPEAVRCAQVNALIHHVDHQVDVRLGDLFEPVRGERFDVVLFNPPYYRGHPRDVTDAAWRSVDAFDRFLAQLPAHLTRGGFALVVLSTDGDVGSALRAAAHLKTRLVRERDFGNERLVVYEVRAIS